MLTIYPNFHGLDQLTGEPHLFFTMSALSRWVNLNKARNIRSNEPTSYKYVTAHGYAIVHYDGDEITMYTYESTRYMVRIANPDVNLQVKLWR